MIIFTYTFRSFSVCQPSPRVVSGVPGLGLSLPYTHLYRWFFLHPSVKVFILHASVKVFFYTHLYRCFFCTHLYRSISWQLVRCK